LRHTSAQIERALDGKSFLFLPGDLAPTFIAPARINQAASGIWRQFAPGAGRRTQIECGTNIRRFRQRRHRNAGNGEPQNMQRKFHGLPSVHDAPVQDAKLPPRKRREIGEYCRLVNLVLSIAPKALAAKA
jgi:hypothetical protein